MINQTLKLGFSVVKAARQNWNKCLRERTFGKNSTQKIRQPEGDKKCIGSGIGTKHNKNYRVTHIAKNA